jgi:hypothetical protein
MYNRPCCIFMKTKKIINSDILSSPITGIEIERNYGISAKYCVQEGVASQSIERGLDFMFCLLKKKILIPNSGLNWQFKSVLWLSPLMCLVALTFSNISDAQIIDNRNGNAFREEIFFSQQFLWLNKVRSITGVTSIKRPNRPIEQRPDLVVYRFNEVGLLQQMDKVSSVFNLVDSMSIRYRRNDIGEVFQKEETGSRGYFTTNYNYDEQGKLIRIDYGTAENISSAKDKLMPGQVITINSESYAWRDQQNGVSGKSVYNNYGLHYSNWTITRSQAGFIETESEELIMSGKTTTRTYTYDEHGWIAAIQTKDNMSAAVKSQTFNYDHLGNLLKVNYYDNKNLIREIEVLYTPTLLVEAFLDHDLQSHDIVITKFSYEFNK